MRVLELLLVENVIEMLEKNYIRNKEKIFDYLNLKKCFCFRTTIIADLMILGMKKYTVSSTLREMRKRKEIKKGFRRWGL